MPEPLNSIAVLIDADNASVKNIGQILQEIQKHGTIRTKKIYGDWGNAHIQSWQEALLTYAIDPMQQFAYVKGKNATDIGMVIEAMDLLYSGEYDGFCLISSDSDFTSLALRIRKNGVKVFGFGKNNTVSAFRQACDVFFCVEDLADKSTTKENKNLSNLNNKNSKANNQPDDVTPITPWKTQQLHTQTHLIGVMNKIIRENPNAQNHQGWTNLSYLASQLTQNYPNIKLDKYGYKKFSDLITAIRLYDIKRDNSRVLIKFKTKKSAEPAKTNPTNDKSAKPKNTAPPHQSLTPKDTHAQQSTNLTQQTQNQTQPNILSACAIKIQLITALNIDAVIFRVNQQGKVRGDEDMIFYGQTHSEDGSIVLDQQTQDNHSIFEFDCDLTCQPNDITQLIIVLSSELDSIETASHQPYIKVTVHDAQKETLIFSEQFDAPQKSGKSLLLFGLNRQSNNSDWQLTPKNQTIHGDLRHLCEHYGVDISDD